MEIDEQSSTYADVNRARMVYGEAFRKAFEYIYGNGIDGSAIMEFGTYMGFTAGIIARLMREFENDRVCYPEGKRCRLYLMDSFEGFPDSKCAVDENGHQIKRLAQWKAGMESVPPGTEIQIEEYLSRIIPISRISIVKGFYEDTLPSVRVNGQAALIHMDCDLYSSTKTVLNYLCTDNILHDGCVLMCDDYNCNVARPDQGQRRALSEVLDRQDSTFSRSDFFSYGWHGRAFFVHRQ